MEHITKILKEKDQCRILYPVKITSKNEGQIKTLSDKNWRKSSLPDLCYEKMLKKVIWEKGKLYQMEN